jgi:hypothetical protein
MQPFFSVLCCLGNCQRQERQNRFWNWMNNLQNILTYSIIWTFSPARRKLFRSQWPRSLRYVMSSPAQTLGSCRLYRVLTMGYNTQNHWVFGLCPSFGIIETRSHSVCFRPQVRGDTPFHLGTLERAYLKRLVQWLGLTLFKGPNWVGVSPLHLRTETDPVSKTCVFYFVKTSSFRNAVFSSFYNTGRWTKSKNPVILTGIMCSNPLRGVGVFIFLCLCCPM